jgi:ketosteroid isomerase-like protein
MKKRQSRLTSLVLALILSLGMLALSPKPATADCDCWGTTMVCWVKNGDGTWGWISRDNHPKCMPV